MTTRGEAMEEKTKSKMDEALEHLAKIAEGMTGLMGIAGESANELFKKVITQVLEKKINHGGGEHKFIIKIDLLKIDQILPLKLVSSPLIQLTQFQDFNKNND
jgi:hypothetical protein